MKAKDEHLRAKIDSIRADPDLNNLAEFLAISDHDMADLLEGMKHVHPRSAAISRREVDCEHPQHIGISLLQKPLVHNEL